MNPNKMKEAVDNLYQVKKETRNFFKKCNFANEILFLSTALKYDLVSSKSNKQQKLQRYKRGTIIKANFGINIGSELSGPHYALVITKKDNPYSEKITVIPFTSKSGKHNIELPFNISQEILSYFSMNYLPYTSDDSEDEFNLFVPIFAKRAFPATFYTNRSPKKELTISADEKQKVLKRIYNLSKTFSAISYLKLDNITTISKRRIININNDNDPIGKILLYKDQLETIDKEVSAYILDL